MHTRGHGTTPTRRKLAIAAFACVLIIAHAGAQSPPPNEAATQPQRTLLIVHPPLLRDSAAEWDAYRAQRGWAVVRVEVPPAAPAADAADPDAQRTAIRSMIRAAHATAQDSDFAVLLLGDDDVLPAWRFPQTDPLVMDRDRQYISDQPYQFADDTDEIPDFALGRVPARSNDEARALLKKLEKNEHAASAGVPADQAARITYVAGEGHFGAMDALLESMFIMLVDRFVPDAFDLSMTYAKPSSVYCPPPSQLTQTVLQRLTEGGLLFNYVGHGSERGFDSLNWNDKRIPILRTRDLAALESDDAETGNRQRPVAFMSCCSVGHFDMPDGEACLSEALLFHPAGPIAIISGSRITHPYANTVLQKDITHALLIDRAPTAGMLDLMAERSLLKQGADDREIDFLAGTIARQMKWTTSLRDLRSMHARMYNLLGDPATELALPAMGVTSLALRDGNLTGKVEGVATGRVTLRIETPRAQSAKAERMLKVEGTGDPDLERKAANNYPLANDRLLLEIEGEVKDGAFDIELPQPLPANAGTIRVSVQGVDKQGAAREAIGALRLTQP